MEAMLRALGRKEEEEERTKVEDDMEGARAYVAGYNEPAEAFQPGDLVVWKDGMKTRRFPEYGQPIMVVETFPAVRQNPDGTPYACEANDMRCLVFKDEEGDWLAFSYNSRMFNRYPSVK